MGTLPPAESMKHDEEGDVVMDDEGDQKPGSGVEKDGVKENEVGSPVEKVCSDFLPFEFALKFMPYKVYFEIQKSIISTVLTEVSP